MKHRNLDNKVTLKSLLKNPLKITSLKGFVQDINYRVFARWNKVAPKHFVHHKRELICKILCNRINYFKYMYTYRKR